MHHLTVCYYSDKTLQLCYTTVVALIVEVSIYLHKKNQNDNSKQFWYSPQICATKTL